MKQLWILFLLASSCVFAQKSTVTRSLPSFDKIGVSGGFDKILLKEGDSESVKLELSGIDPDKIETEVKDGTLKIGTKKGLHSRYKATVTVTYRNLKGVANSGSTDVEALGTISGESFSLASSGSGDFKGEFDVRKLHIAISGSSDMQLFGKASEQDIAISGSGDVDASKLKGSSAKVAISGSGDVRLNVDGKVKTAVSGSGRVVNE
jgi:Protein of unknown function (DUF2807).